jgi:hypothetical protein
MELLPTGGDIRLGHYTVDHLLALGRESKRREFMAPHERLRSVGLVSLALASPAGQTPPAAGVPAPRERRDILAGFNSPTTVGSPT